MKKTSFIFNLIGLGDKIILVCDLSPSSFRFYSRIFSKLLERLLMEEGNGYYLNRYYGGHALFVMARKSPHHKNILELLLGIGVYKEEVNLSLYLLSTYFVIASYRS